MINFITNIALTQKLQSQLNKLNAKMEQLWNIGRFVFGQDSLVGTNVGLVGNSTSSFCFAYTGNETANDENRPPRLRPGF